MVNQVKHSSILVGGA